MRYQVLHQIHPIQNHSGKAELLRLQQSANWSGKILTI
jgi:hypothetical protein